MQTIPVGKFFELLLDTLSQCGSDILKLSDEMIGNYVLEEGIIGVTSFFSKFTLERLENEVINSYDLKFTNLPKSSNEVFNEWFEGESKREYINKFALTICHCRFSLSSGLILYKSTLLIVLFILISSTSGL
ncbi:hypothetical protein [Bacillus sp. XF8]|uniref:hypothetical protein n=1 Tax=Bacillus sp. XF8 TaxID=2819289 RepID=UPI001AA0A664|nr:hypothetical protein [Bacillus sp. XF8]MBO1580109.1 hypothetical protein [Bacillus sp. XF8]